MISDDDIAKKARSTKITSAVIIPPFDKKHLILSEMESEHSEPPSSVFISKSLFIIMKNRVTEDKISKTVKTVYSIYKVPSVSYAFVSISIITEPPLFSKCRSTAGTIVPVLTVINPATSPTINANGICTKLPCTKPNSTEETIMAEAAEEVRKAADISVLLIKRISKESHMKIVTINRLMMK